MQFASTSFIKQQFAPNRTGGGRILSGMVAVLVLLVNPLGQAGQAQVGFAGPSKPVGPAADLPEPVFPLVSPFAPEQGVLLTPPGGELGIVTGRVVLTDDQRMTVLIHDKHQQTHLVPIEAEILLNRGPAELEDLQPGDMVRVFIDPEFPSVAKRIVGARVPLRPPVATPDYAAVGPPYEDYGLPPQLTLGAVVTRSPVEHPIVAAVTPESPAAQAGIRPGDLIVAANGRDVRDITLPQDLIFLIPTTDPGNRIVFDVSRDGEVWGVEFDLQEILRETEEDAEPFEEYQEPNDAQDVPAAHRVERDAQDRRREAEYRRNGQPADGRLIPPAPEEPPADETARRTEATTPNGRDDTDTPPPPIDVPAPPENNEIERDDPIEEDETAPAPWNGYPADILDDPAPQPPKDKEVDLNRRFERLETLLHDVIVGMRELRVNVDSLRDEIRELRDEVRDLGRQPQRPRGGRDRDHRRDGGI